MKKRLMALLLCVVMCASLMSVGVFADEASNADDVTVITIGSESQAKQIDVKMNVGDTKTFKCVAAEGMKGDNVTVHSADETVASVDVPVVYIQNEKTTWDFATNSAVTLPLDESAHLLHVTANNPGTTNITIDTNFNNGTEQKTTYTISVVVDYAAYIGSVGYKTLQEAVNAAVDSENTEIILAGNVAEDVIIPADKIITLNLNGYTVENVSNHTIRNLGSLTINGNGNLYNNTNGRAVLFNDGNAVLNGGYYDRPSQSTTGNTNTHYTIQNHGIMSVNEGAEFHNNGDYSSLFANGYYTGTTKDNDTNGVASPKLTVNGGLFVGGKIALKNDDCGIVEVYGGEFNNQTNIAVSNWHIAKIYDGVFSAPTAVYNDAWSENLGVGSLTIEGGIFNGKIAMSNNDYGYTQVETTVISGGTFNGELVSNDANATPVITGGTFANDPSEYVADGYKVTKTEGNYVVSEKTQADIMAETVTAIATDIASKVVTNVVTDVFNGFSKVASFFKSYIPTFGK